MPKLNGNVNTPSINLQCSVKQLSCSEFISVSNFGVPPPLILLLRMGQSGLASLQYLELFHNMPKPILFSSNLLAENCRE